VIGNPEPPAQVHELQLIELFGDIEQGFGARQVRVRLHEQRADMLVEADQPQSMGLQDVLHHGNEARIDAEFRAGAGRHDLAMVARPDPGVEADGHAAARREAAHGFELGQRVGAHQDAVIDGKTQLLCRHVVGDEEDFFGRESGQK
jgi:hypothetical protein